MRRLGPRSRPESLRISSQREWQYPIDEEVVYKLHSLIFELKQTDTFRNWWTRLKNERARGLIFSRLSRLAYGHFGDVAAVGQGISELRIHIGPGYRVYFRKRGKTLIILLCGGDKGSQARDIKTAKKLADDWSE